VKRSLLWLLVTPIAIIPACDCGGDSSGTGASGAGASDGSGGAGGATSSGPNFDAGGCASGEPCDGGVCAGNICCAVELACGDACCAAGQVCSFQKCETPGADCADSDECPAGQYCEYSLGDDGAGGGGGAGGGACVGGAAPITGKCLPRPPICPDGQEPDPDNLTCLAACQVVPQTSSFTPAPKHAWGGPAAPPYANDVMMAPIVIELDDDDCDGKVTERDIPEILFATFTNGDYHGPGVLHAISVVNEVVVEKWAAPGIHPTRQLAAGNIDGAPGNEVIACGNDGAVHALGGDGAPRWTSAPMTCVMPSIADLDADGTVEVIVEGGILDGATGQLEAAFSAPLTSSFVVSDIDLDGKLDVVTGSQGFHADGSLFVDTGIANQSAYYGNEDWKSPWPAVGDLDKDGKPEVVVVDNLNHALLVWRHDPAQPGGFLVARAPVDINGPIPASACPTGSWGNLHGGGPPTIADFNGDTYPDVALAGGVGYAVFDGQKLMNPAVAGPETLMWIKSTVDCSSASTGSTVFDFNGDGRAEVVYNDQQRLRIYDGPTGDVLFETCNTTATLIENPVIADVDNDGHADIVVVANAYYSTLLPDVQCNDGAALGQSGVRIYGDPSGEWVRTRRVWNEHAYHITNVHEDGSIPQLELPNYLQPGLDNFRQNKQPGSEFAAPDAVVSLAPRCVPTYSLRATVRNIGEAALPAGVSVGFYAGQPGSGTLLGHATTTRALYPAEAELLQLPLSDPGPVVLDGTVYAIVDDGGVPHPQWAECRTDNNVSKPVSGACDTVE